MTPVSYIQLFAAEAKPERRPSHAIDDSAESLLPMKSAVSNDPPTSDSQAIARSFVAARLAGMALDRYPGQVPATLPAAYECQEAALASWPDRVAGWKVARIAPAWSAQYS